MVEEASVLKYFSALPDPRKDINKKHQLIDIIIISLCAIICGCEHWEEIEQFAKVKKDWFKSFLLLPNGIPSHDRIRAVWIHLDPLEFEKSFRDWIASIRMPEIEGDIISIDGKTACHSFDKKHDIKALHIVSAWSQKNKLVLGQVKTNEKSNEITAIPELLNALMLKGCIITVDAMGCQKDIAQKILDKDADYVIAVKDNQKNLHQEVKNAFLQQQDTILCNSLEEEEQKVHGRSEKRIYYMLGINRNKAAYQGWAGLQSIGMVKAQRLIDGKMSEENRYYILSLENQKKNMRKFAQAVRGHWGIENELHWQLDVSFKEDACRKRTAHAQENFSLLRKIALTLLKNEKSQTFGVKSKSKLAGWDNEYLLKVLFAR